MMLSEAAHRFAPQFMIPLVKYLIFLEATFEEAISEITGHVLKTFIFPIMEFFYNTWNDIILLPTRIIGSVMPTLSVIYYMIQNQCYNTFENCWGSCTNINNRNNSNVNEYENENDSDIVGAGVRVMMEDDNDNDNDNAGQVGAGQSGQAGSGGAINGFINSLRNMGYKRRNNDDYCGSSFDNSSMGSVASGSVPSVPAAAQGQGQGQGVASQGQGQGQGPLESQAEAEAEGIDDSNNNVFNFDSSTECGDDINSKNDDYYSTQFKQQFMDTVSEYATQAGQLRDEIHTKLDGSWQTIKQMKTSITPKKLHENVDCVRQYSFNSINYVKSSVEYYVNLIRNVITDPMAFANDLKEYLLQKRDVYFEYRENVDKWINFGYLRSIDCYNYLKQSFIEIKNGEFDYWQAIYDVSELSQEYLDKFLQYLGHESIIYTIVTKSNVVNGLTKVNTYANGRRVNKIHEKQS